MKRRRRIICTGLAALSALLCVGVLLMLIASYRYGAIFFHHFLRQDDTFIETRPIRIYAAWGSLHIDIGYLRMISPALGPPDKVTSPGEAIRAAGRLKRAKQEWAEQKKFVVQQVREDNQASRLLEWGRTRRDPWPVTKTKFLGFTYYYDQGTSPTKYHLNIRLPLWMVALALLLATVLFRALRGRTPKASDCQNCGYDLTANGSGICPECGVTIKNAAA